MAMMTAGEIFGYSSWPQTGQTRARSALLRSILVPQTPQKVRLFSQRQSWLAVMPANAWYMGRIVRNTWVGASS